MRADLLRHQYAVRDDPSAYGRPRLRLIGVTFLPPPSVANPFGYHWWTKRSPGAYLIDVKGHWARCRAAIRQRGDVLPARARYQGPT